MRSLIKIIKECIWEYFHPISCFKQMLEESKNKKENK